MKIETLAIGDELLDGRLADTNSRDFARALFDFGHSLSRCMVADDSVEAIAEAVREASGRADILVTSGGLGPTTDDLTAEGIARALNEEIELHAPSWKRIQKRFKEAGFELAPNNIRQAEVPQSATILQNDKGSAPGFLTRVGGCDVYSFPGVPREYRHLIETYVLPRFSKKKQATASRTIRCLGITESKLGALIEPFTKKNPEVRIQYRTSFPENHLRFVLSGKSQRTLDKQADALVTTLRKQIGKSAYAEGSDPLEAHLVQALSQRGITLSTAESCTGGLISKRLTEVPGVSSVFMGGTVSYSNEIKMAHLSVSPDTLNAFGAVSEEVAKEMAQGARINHGTDIGISVTGVAGPGGGTKDKPVGTVCFGFSSVDKTLAKTRFVPFRGRQAIREMSAAVALRFVLTELGIEFSPMEKSR